MPIWGSYFLLHLFHQSFALNDFAKHGEFALYTAAFLAPALQQVVSNIKNAKYVLGTGAVLVSVTGLVISAIIYSGLTTGITLIALSPNTTAAGKSAAGLNEQFLFNATLVLFVLSLLFAVVVTLVEKVVLETHAGGVGSASEKHLQETFAVAKPEVIPPLPHRPAEITKAPDVAELELARAFDKSHKPGEL